MSRIISSGERNPLRVISELESISRFSEQRRTFDDGNGKFIFEEDINYIQHDISNVQVNAKDRSISIAPVTKYPNGLDIDKILPHRDGNLQVPFYAKNNNMEFIADYCRLRNYDAVIELGSGYAQNLIKLHFLGGPKVPYYAGEYTKSGCECASMLGDLDSEINLIPFDFDYLSADFSSIKQFDNVLVFTCHSIEQVTNIPKDLIPKISRIADNVTCIHIEPFGFQLTSSHNESEVDKCHRSFFAKNAWNQNLASSLVYHHLCNNIELNYISPNIMGGLENNPSSLALWKSR